MEKIGIKNNKILILYLLIFVLSLCCCGLGLSLETNKQVEAVEIISDEFVLDEYALNSEVTFPNQITVTYSSEECVAENGFVVYPDGKVVAVGKITLDQIGEYSIQYDFTCQNKRYVAVKAFNVSKKLYGLTTDNGSIIPVSAESQADGQYNGNLNDVMMTKEDGIIVRLSEGNTFEYTKSLDLTNVNSDGLCEIITLDYKFLRV